MGQPYTESIDMWSLACVLTELYLGWPLFPGSSEYDQISYICQMLGPPPQQLFSNLSKTSHFFSKQYGQWALKVRFPSEMVLAYSVYCHYSPIFCSMDSYVSLFG